MSRGGEKLEKALDAFGIAVDSRSVVDVGSSTGGFTDCVLQRGASRVFAVDVGRNQLHERIASDPRVTWREGINVRDMSASDMPFPCSLLVADLSFISLTVVMPALRELVGPEQGFGEQVMVLLVKPQFEAGKAEADKGEGVITDPAVHARVLAELEAFVGAELPAVAWRGVTESPLLGPAGNKEFLVLLARV